MTKLLTRDEARRRRMRFEIFAGMFDFLAVVAGVVVIIACIILLTSLVKWVAGDAQVTFKSLWETFMKAIVVPE